MKKSKKSTLPLILDSFKAQSLTSNNAFKWYKVVKSSKLQSSKVLITPFVKPISNFKNE